MAPFSSGPIRFLVAVVVSVLLVVPSLAAAVTTVIIGGGGSSSSDCLLVFDAPANDPPNKPRNIRCTDGDSSCDADGVVNGVCAFPIKPCANSSYNPSSCNLVGVDQITVDHALDNGDEKFDPDYQALQQRIDNDISPPNDDPDACAGSATTIRVAIEGPFKANNGTNVCKKRIKKMKIVSTGIIAGKVWKDTDKIKMTCDPAPAIDGGCDPQVFFTGTFDRIQRQIFDQTCAVSGCHDSQSVQGSLLLETGASYGNLVNATPNNAAAANTMTFPPPDDWKRVKQIDAMTGDLNRSLLYHKVTGDLLPGFGDRMPFHRKKLDQSLIDVIEAWIVNGAPQTGWLPGTF